MALADPHHHTHPPDPRSFRDAIGMFAVDAFEAIVNAPQAAILAVGRIRERAVALNGVLLARPMMTMTVSFDHRVVDGARGARFLETLADLVEEPAALVE